MIGLVPLDPVFDRVKQRIIDLAGILLIARFERIEGLWGETGAPLMQKSQPWLAVKAGNPFGGESSQRRGFQ
jgi:hypothetical protein